MQRHGGLIRAGAEVREGLRDAVLANVEVFCFQIRKEFAAAVDNSDSDVDDVDARLVRGPGSSGLATLRRRSVSPDGQQQERQGHNSCAMHKSRIIASLQPTRMTQL